MSTVPKQVLRERVRDEVLEAERVHLLEVARFLRQRVSMAPEVAALVDDVIDHLQRRGPGR